VKIAYVLGAFPNTSETFVLHQLAAAVASGYVVEIHAYRVPGHVQHALIEQHHLLRYVRYRPSLPDAKFWRLLKLLPLMLLLLMRDPHHTLALFPLKKEMALAEWVELFFLAWPLCGGRRYDVIHAHFGPNGQAACQLRCAGFLQGRVITSFHGFDVNVVPRLRGRDYYHTLFSEGDAFIVSSRFICQKLCDLGLSDEKIHRIPVGVALSHWHFEKRSGWQGAAPQLISVGRLVEVKGFADAIAALALVRKVFPDVRYRLIGDGPLRQSLAQMVEDLGLQNQVIFSGSLHQEALTEAYQTSDLFIMPSLRASDGAEEGQGMVLLEAQATGLPVVATRNGGIPESVPEGTALCEAGNPAMLADAIITRLQNLRQHGYDGMAGREHVQQHFDIEQRNCDLFALYRHLAKEALCA